MLSFMRSTVGRKYLMAVTGTLWAGFVLSHMLGNMLIFVSPDAYNKYSHALTTSAIIYVAEALLALSLIPHIINGIFLTFKNKRSKGIGYEGKGSCAKKASLASRTMGPQGLLVLIFIILHLIGFKYGTYYETTVDGVVMRDIFRLVVEVFHNPAYVAWYIFCLSLLGFHLSHGVGSVFQSLGFLTYSNQALVKKISLLYAIIVAIGFIAQPIYVMFFVS